jgi:hypothetical protein
MKIRHFITTIIKTNITLKTINETNLVLIPKTRISSTNTNRVNIIIIVVFMSLLMLTKVSVLLLYILHIKPKRTINQPVIHDNIELQSFNLSNFVNIKEDVEKHSIII